jgi:hypothetical protein
MFIVSLILAMLFASLPMTRVFAAPASDQGPTEDENLPQEWSNKLDNLWGETRFYSRVRVYPADFENAVDLARAYFLIHQYGFALQQAQTIVANHTGFDLKGHVTNDIQAEQTVKDLAIYLQIMRGLRAKIDEEGYNIRLVK